MNPSYCISLRWYKMVDCYNVPIITYSTPSVDRDVAVGRNIVGGWSNQQWWTACGQRMTPCSAPSWCPNLGPGNTDHSSALIIRVHPLVRPYRVQQRQVVVLHQGTMTYLGSGIRYVYPSASKSYITMVTLYGHGYYKHEHWEHTEPKEQIIWGKRPIWE
jgi:hypothetical protein